MMLLPSLPIIVLLVCLLLLKLSPLKSGAIAIITTIFITSSVYGFDTFGLFVSIKKGISLSLSIVLIIWGAILLYNLVSLTGALYIINKNIKIIITDQFFQFVALSWIFSSLMQGIAGFGVPVVIVSTILIEMGFEPVKSVAAVLVGHSWSICFGSMGSSIYAINLVTDSNIHDTVLWMSFFGVIPMFFTGLTICYFFGGFKCIKENSKYILILTVIMGTTLIGIAKLSMHSVIGLLTSLVGLFTIYIIYWFKYKPRKDMQFYGNNLNLLEAIIPYTLVIIMSVLMHFLNLQTIISFDFPGYTTRLGNIVQPAINYATINYLKHPLTIILFSSIVSSIIFRRKNCLDAAKLKTIAMSTINKCIPITFTLFFLSSIAVLMTDSGMINQIGQQVIISTNKFYPIFAPFIGLLGSFVTGSTTNSNVIFGKLQETVACNLGLRTSIACAMQSIGASSGGGLSSSSLFLGAAAAKLQGNEVLIYKKTFLHTLLTELVLGLVYFTLTMIMI